MRENARLTGFLQGKSKGFTPLRRKISSNRKDKEEDKRCWSIW